jgi:hypothetical protein
MSKTLLLAAVAGIALGAGLLVRAYAAEIGVGAAGPYAWYGLTNPAAEQGFMLVGILLLATGLAGVAVLIARRLPSAPIPTPVQVTIPIPVRVPYHVRRRAAS